MNDRKNARLLLCDNEWRMVMQITVYYDFLCPVCWRASRWLDTVVAQRPSVVIDWRPFSLEQVNTPADSAWRIWEQDGDDYLRHDGSTNWSGLHGFWAAEAVRLQSTTLYNTFRAALFEARHTQKIALNQRAPVAAVAAACGVDMARYTRDTHDPAVRDVIRRDFEHARAQYTCFGGPTLCFDDHNAVYVKVRDHVPADDALPLFDDVVNSFIRRSHLTELKRPN